MEVYNKRLLMIFSIAQIVLSVIFFTLGMVDGFQIRFVYVSLFFTPCWIAALSLPVGVMGLVLAYRRTPSSFLITATWSFSVACILFSAMTVYLYHHWGCHTLLSYKHIRAQLLDPGSTFFIKKETKVEYTDEEKNALAVFILMIIFSIIEISIAAAIAKTSSASDQTPQTLQPFPMYYMYNQAGQAGGQTICANTGVPQTHNETAGDQHVLIHQ